MYDIIIIIFQLFYYNDKYFNYQYKSLASIILFFFNYTYEMI